MELDFVVPGSIHQISGGYIYDKKIIAGLAALDQEVNIIELAGTFPFVEEKAISAAQKNLYNSGLIVIDGLALPAFSSLLPLPQKKVVALVHHPLYEETGICQEEQEFLFLQEKTNLQKVDHIIATSDFTKQELVTTFGIQEKKISVVVPGNELLPLSEGSKQETIHFLAVGSIIPRKGYNILLLALSKLKNLSWKLHCVGNTKDKIETQKIHSIIQKNELTQRVHFLGELPEKEVQLLYQKSDVFVSSSYHEGFGMAISEARSCGMPVISTRAGAVSQILQEQDALLCQPGDIEGLSKLLKEIILSQNLRSKLQQKSIAYRQTLLSWQQMSEKFAEVLFSLMVKA